MDQLTCPICLDAIGVAQVTLDCGHVHCVSCFVKWSQKSNTCSCCRAEFIEAKPEREEKRTLHAIQIDSLVKFNRSELKNRNYELYNDIINMSRETPGGDKIEIENMLGRLIDENTQSISLRMQNYYEE